MKLEDLPMYIPLIKIIDKGYKNPEPRLFGNNVHDVLVVDYNARKLSYYNCQCGDGSECGDFKFVKEEPTCIDDKFYSCWCQNINLDELIKIHEKEFEQEVRKQVCDEIREILDIQDSYMENITGVSLTIQEKSNCHINKILDQIEKGEKER